MLIESLATAFLKYKYSKTLQFDTFQNIEPPRPEPGSHYLLYIHIPFCEELCPYCSFNRFPFQRELALRYFKALKVEMRNYADLGFTFQSVYVGGGTPTVLPDEMADILVTAGNLFGVKEISLETNPNHLIDPVMNAMKQAGVNRLSVGVQSFDDDLLKQMDRFHKYGSGEQITERLQHYMGFFDTLNVDMIFNFPTQTQPVLEKDLEIIKKIKADQVTFYPLMVSDITKRELAKRFGHIDYSVEKRFYNIISDTLLDEYTCGTAWCFSRKKSMIDEYIVDYDEYIGVGSGAFAYANGACFANTFALDEYIRAAEEHRFPLFAKKAFNLKDRIDYHFMMKLFSTSMNLVSAEEKFENQFRKYLRKELTALKLLGSLEIHGDILKLTQKGRYLWVIMMREFFTGVNNFRDICRSSIGCVR